MFDNNCVTCIAPWYSIRIDTDGSYKYCDFSSATDQSTQLPSQWFLNSNHVATARASIQQGLALSGCAHCYHNEKNNFESYRQRRNIQAAIHHGDYFKESLTQSPAFERMHQTNLTNKGPAFIHVSLSNVCNLSCRMCNPSLSSKLSIIYKKINIISKNTPTLLDWTEDKDLWQDFSENLILGNTDLICLHFMGGEPLYHEKFYQLLETCVARSKTDFHITFVTNGTIWNPELVNTLSKFKSVAVEISLENFHKTNNYIRNGADFEVVRQNIIKLLDNKTDNISVVLRTVPQALSIQHYDTVIDFALEHNLHIDANMLFDPFELSISVLPQKCKQEIIEKLNSKYADFLSRYGGKFLVQEIRNQTQQKTQMTYHIQKIIRLLSAVESDNIEDLRYKFVDYNQKFDQVTGTSFRSYYPDLVDFYEKYHKH